MKLYRKPAAFVLPLLAACGILSPDGGVRSELEENRDRWEEGRPTRYAVTIERNCFCTPDGRGPVTVTVDGPAVTARVYSDSGEPVPDGLAHVFPSIDGLFDFVLDALDRDAHEVRVTYDAGTAIPISVSVDYEENAIDEEVGFTVTLPLVTDL